METHPVIESIFAQGQALMEGLHAILNAASIPHVMTGAPSMFSIMMGAERAPVDYRSYATGDFSLYEEICAELMQRGIFLDDDPREPWFISYSHDQKVVAETLEIAEAAVRAAMQERVAHKPLPLAA